MDLRMVTQEARKHGLQDHANSAFAGVDSDVAARRIVQSVNHLHRLCYRRDCGTKFIGESLSCVCQRHAAGSAVEEANTKTLFEDLDRMADCRRGNVELNRCRAKTTVRRHPPASDYLSCYLILIDMVRGR